MPAGTIPTRTQCPARLRLFLFLHQRMFLDAMAQLVISQAQRLGRLPLVPAMFAQRMLHNGAFMRINRSAQIIHGIQIRRRRR